MKIIACNKSNIVPFGIENGYWVVAVMELTAFVSKTV